MQTGELDMGLRLVVDSMPNVRQLAPPHLLALIQSDKNVDEIAADLQITSDQATKHVVELIKRGKLITLSNLKAFCGNANACDPNEIQEQLTDDELCATSPPNAIEAIVDRIRSECPNASEKFIEVVLAYYQVRHHLKSKRQPYVDVVDDTLVKGKLLLIPISTANRKTEPDYDAKPSRFNPNTDIIDMDSFFGNHVDDYDPDESSCSEDSERDSENITEISNDDDDSFLNHDEFFTNYTSDESESSHSHQSESSENDVEARVNGGSQFESNGIIDDCDIESETLENQGGVDVINPTISTTSMKRASSFQMSIESESDGDIDENELCTAVMDAYEILFEPPMKIRRSDA